MHFTLHAYLLYVLLHATFLQCLYFANVAFFVNFVSQKALRQTGSIITKAYVN